MQGYDLYRPAQRFVQSNHLTGHNNFNNNRAPVNFQRPQNLLQPLSHFKNVPFPMQQASLSQIGPSRPRLPATPFQYTCSSNIPPAITQFNHPHSFLRPRGISSQYSRHPNQIQNFENNTTNHQKPPMHFNPRSFATPQRPLYANHLRAQYPQVHVGHPNEFSSRQKTNFNQQTVSNNKFTFNGADNKQKKKKIKERFMAFFCEACDRGWNTEEAFNKHKAEHITCGLEGCPLTAHPKVIEKHIQLQHATGLFKRISVSYKPEDIEKWISDRKSRFPTQDTIQKKQLQKEEMAARGEVEPKNNRFNRPGFNGGRDRKRYPNRRQNGRKRRYQNMMKKIESEMVVDNIKKENESKDNSSLDNNNMKGDNDSWRGDLPQFPGTAAFPEVQECDAVSTVVEEFSDEEWQNTEGVSHDSRLMSQALTSLCGAYASDSGEEQDEQEMPPKNKCKTVLTNTDKTDDNSNINSENKPSESTKDLENEIKVKTESICESASEDEAPEEMPLSKPENDIDHETTKESVTEHTSNSTQDSSSKNNSTRNSYQKKPITNVNSRYPRKRRRLTLLERLLSREITHERNVILQCVRYTVQNDFFNTR